MDGWIILCMHASIDPAIHPSRSHGWLRLARTLRSQQTRQSEQQAAWWAMSTAARRHAWHPKFLQALASATPQRGGPAPHELLQLQSIGFRFHHVSTAVLWDAADGSVHGCALSVRG